MTRLHPRAAHLLPAPPGPPALLVPVLHLAGCDLSSEPGAEAVDVVETLAPESLLLGLQVPSTQSNGEDENNPVILQDTEVILEPLDERLKKEIWPLSIDVFNVQLESVPKIAKAKKTPAKPQGIKVKVEHYASGNVAWDPEMNNNELQITLYDAEQMEKGVIIVDIIKEREETKDGENSEMQENDTGSRRFTIDLGELKIDGAAPITGTIVQGELKLGKISIPILDGRGQYDGTTIFEECIQEQRLVNALLGTTGFNIKPELTLSEMRKKASAGELKKGSKITDLMFDRMGEVQKTIDNVMKLLKTFLHPKIGGNEAEQTAYNIELVPTITNTSQNTLATCFDKTRVINNACDRIIYLNQADITTLIEDIAETCHSSLPTLSFTIWPSTGEPWNITSPNIVGYSHLGKLLLLKNGEKAEIETVLSDIIPRQPETNQPDTSRPQKGQSRPPSSKTQVKGRNAAQSGHNLDQYSLMKPRITSSISLSSPLCSFLSPPEPLQEEPLGLSDNEEALRIVTEWAVERKVCQELSKTQTSFDKNRIMEASANLKKAILNAVTSLHSTGHTEADTLRIVLNSVEDGMSPYFGGRMITAPTQTRIEKLVDQCQTINVSMKNALFDLRSSPPGMGMEMAQNLSKVLDKADEVIKIMDNDPYIADSSIEECCLLRLEVSLLSVTLINEPIELIINAVESCRKHVNNWNKPEIILATSILLLLNNRVDDSFTTLKLLALCPPETLDGVSWAAAGIILEKLNGKITPESSKYWEKAYSSLVDKKLYYREMEHNYLVLSVAEKLIYLIPNCSVLDFLLGELIQVSEYYENITQTPTSTSTSLPVIKVDSKTPVAPVEPSPSISFNISPRSETLNNMEREMFFRTNLLKAGGGENGGWIYALDSEYGDIAYNMIRELESRIYYQYSSQSLQWKIILAILTSLINKAEEAAKFVLNIVKELGNISDIMKVQCCNILLRGSDIINVRTQKTVSKLILDLLSDMVHEKAPSSVLSLVGYSLVLSGRAEDSQFLLRATLKHPYTPALYHVRYALALFRTNKYREAENEALSALHKICETSYKTHSNNTETRLLCYEFVKTDSFLVDIASRLCDVLKSEASDRSSIDQNEPVIYTGQYRQLKLNLECVKALNINNQATVSALAECMSFLNTHPCVKLETIQEKVELTRLELELKEKQ